MLSIRGASQENWSGDVELEFSPQTQCRFDRPRFNTRKGPDGVGRTLLSAALDLNFPCSLAPIESPSPYGPLLWVGVFLLVPYAILFCYSFWSVSSSQQIVHSWTLDNYRQLLQVNVYWQTLFRSMWIAARVMIFSLFLGYPLAYFLSFHAKKKELLYQLVIIPLWVSYLVRAYAWKPFWAVMAFSTRYCNTCTSPDIPSIFCCIAPSR